MTNATTAPVQSLHDQIMRLPCTPPKDANVNQMLAYKSGHRDARHAAAELAAVHEVEQAAPVAVQGELRAKAENFVARMRKGAEDDRGAERELEGEDADEAQACAVQAYLQEGAADMVEQLLSAAPTPPAGPWESPCTPPAQQSQWVPVSERLPEIDTPVFLYEPNFGIWIGGCADADDGWMWAHAQGTQWFADGKWKADLFIDDDYKPSHWMPLPAAPGDTAAPEQAEPRLAISSQEQLAALLNGVQALHEISAELIAECVFEQMQAATGETEAPEQAEQTECGCCGQAGPCDQDCDCAEQAAVKVPRELLECIVIAESQGDGPALHEAIDELRTLLGGDA